jgi:hypothetical protein
MIRNCFVYLLLAAFLLQSCNLLGMASPDEGELRISFARQQDALTRAGLAVPDTCDFILTVKDSKGNVVYEGTYGESPESMMLKSGGYTVKVISSEFPKPAFSSPQFGDEQYVMVSAGETVNLRLVCTQMNCGIRLFIDPLFLDAYPDGALLLKSSFGRLMYGYKEKRVAYFTPGNISLILSNQGKDETLLTRTLDACEILDLKICVSGSSDSSSATGSSGGMSVVVDTARVWLSESYVMGQKDSGSGVLTVYQARSMAGEEGVSVSGYIVGGDLTSSSASFQKPFTYRTNILLGPRSSTSDKSSCLSVQLPSGELREALNLVDNPFLLGRKVCLTGDIVESYYGIPGLKNITEYELY